MLCSIPAALGVTWFVRWAWGFSPLWNYEVSMTVIFAFMGLSFIFFTAGLHSLPTEVLEAARCDGAGWWSTLWRVT